MGETYRPGLPPVPSGRPTAHSTALASGYRLYRAEVLELLTFVGQARRLGLTLNEIKHIVLLRRNRSAPCEQVRVLLEHKDLARQFTTLQDKLGPAY